MHEVIRPIARRIVRRARQVDYQRRHRVLAEQLLTTIESERGVLAEATRRRCEEYAREELGSHQYRHWLMVYSAVRGEFVEGWIPDDYYGAVVIPNIQGAYGEVSNLKGLTRSIFGSDAFPDRAYLVNGTCYRVDGESISPDRLAAHLFSDGDKTVFKVDESQQGLGVFVLDAASFSLDTVLSKGNGVFQDFILQHAFFDQFTSRSVATLRLTTVMATDVGEPQLRACYLRLGRESDEYVRSASHVRVAVDVRTGALADRAYLSDWRSTDRHPDSGAAFAGKAIPNFGACVAQVLALHRSLPFVGSIGWDVAIDRDGDACVMEWNGGHNDIKFSEAVQGPCFTGLGWNGLWREQPPAE